MRRKIFILYTGGTIGMGRGSDGPRLGTVLAGKALQPFSDDLDFDWHICDSPIDSSVVMLEDWRGWLDILTVKIPQYDGVLVLHGTDTMAYTTNLSILALQGPDKPVVLTGSQWPHNANGSDASFNLSAVVAAFPPGLKEVIIVLNGKLYPIIGSSKIDTEITIGFASPHFDAITE